jgi:hypothetical protein
MGRDCECERCKGTRTGERRGGTRTQHAIAIATRACMATLLASLNCYGDSASLCVCVCSLAVRWITPLTTRNLPLLFPLSLNMGMPHIPARALPLARPALGGEPGPQ